MYKNQNINWKLIPKPNDSPSLQSIKLQYKLLMFFHVRIIRKKDQLMIAKNGFVLKFCCLKIHVRQKIFHLTQFIVWNVLFSQLYISNDKLFSRAKLVKKQSQK